MYASDRGRRCFLPRSRVSLAPLNRQISAAAVLSHGMFEGILKKGAGPRRGIARYVVPLTDDALLGALSCDQSEVRPFSERAGRVPHRQSKDRAALRDDYDQPGGTAVSLRQSLNLPSWPLL